MATLTLKNVPDSLLEELRKRAAGERRSVNQEAIRILELVLLADEGPRETSEAARRQAEAWRGLAGKWQSSRSVAEELERIYSARTPGRDVTL